MNPLLQESLGSIARWVLAIFAGYLVKAGIWTDSDAQTYVAAGALALVALAWSQWQKYRGRIKFVQALASPKGTTEAQVEEMLADPQVYTPPVTLRKDAKPTEVS